VNPVFETIGVRDGGRCVRCRGQADERHHRRSRSILDEHTDCACNLILMCGWGNHTGCHGWAHAGPALARTQGFIVRRTSLDPSKAPLYLPFTRRWVWLTCDGRMVDALPPQKDDHDARM
jgi:hypothetical protein